MTDAFAHAVLDWYHRHGRKDLPWQQNVTPYRVWVSEIMLQQTQVSTVLGYFDRFTQAFPTVGDLAQATEDEVLHLWTGLGYYSRARNLQKTAQLICERHGGEFPRDLKSLMALPGIGRSTAGAIASLAMNIRAPILDGNVKRVLARYYALDGYPGQIEHQRQLWQWAQRLMPHHDIRHYTQAMMDLGATLCTRSKPSCLLCPLRSECCAHRLGRETAYPVPKPRKEKPQKHTVMPLLITSDHHVLLYKRPANGIWGGLWSLPELESLVQLDALQQRHGVQCQDIQPLPSILHTFSHYQLTIEPWIVLVEKNAETMVAASWLWYNLAQPPRLGLAAPVKALLEQVCARRQSPSTVSAKSGESQ